MASVQRTPWRSTSGSTTNRDMSLRNLHASLQKESPIPMNGKENSSNTRTQHTPTKINKQSTPMSLLKSEMRATATDIDQDDCLLFSPLAAKIGPTNSKSTPMRIPVQVSSPTVLRTTTTETERPTVREKRPVTIRSKPVTSGMPPRRVATTSIGPSQNQTLTQTIQPKHSTTNPTTHQTSIRPRLPPRQKATPMTVQQGPTRSIKTVRYAPNKTPMARPLFVKTNDSALKLHQQTLTKATPYVSYQLPADSIVTKPWSTSVFRPTATATPTAGVCMDLSQIFYDASQQTKTVAKPLRTTRKQPRRPSISDTDTNKWAEKQIETFTEWLNFLFYPNADAEHDSALKQLKLYQKLAQQRLKAHQLYEGSEMASVRKILSKEIARGKIALRDDQNLSSNLHQRRSILQMFFCYSENHLRLAVEAVFGVILPYNNTKALKSYIVNNVLSDEKTLLKYTHGKCKVPSGTFENKYLEEIRTMVVYRILVVFFFLDRTKTASILDDSLFKTNSTFKSSKEVLLRFCRDFLKAEGNFIKHLSRVGLKVQFEQSSIDELDFRIYNLRGDLNDGVRLARMTELLTDHTLLHLLRLPAVSRLQKFHNVKLTLDALRDVIPDCIAAHHIVDGHREMVLKLLWSVVAHYCLQALISIPSVKTEISRIQAFHGLESTPKEFDELSNVIIEWCNVIVGGVLRKRTIENLSHSFADGKVVCWLIHFYHPTLIQLEEILPTTHDSQRSRDQLLENERSNSALASRCMSSLGGIPAMIPISDSSNPPEEKSMLMGLSFLCARLMESSLEVRACVLIQNWYRRHRNRYILKLQFAAARIIWATWKGNKSRYYAARKQKYQAAVHVIEAFVSDHYASIARLRLLRVSRERSIHAAIAVQKLAREKLAKQHLAQLKKQRDSAIVLQCFWRQELAFRKYICRLEEYSAVCLIQSAWRHCQARDDRKNSAAIAIQKAFRGYSCRVQYLVDVLDIMAVQSCVRRWLAMRKYAHAQWAIVQIQSAIRSFLTRSQNKRFTKEATAAVTLQCLARRHRARGKLISLRKNILFAIVIQCAWRQVLAKRELGRLQWNRDRLLAATKIQCRWRILQSSIVLQQRKSERQRLLAAIRIQCTWRIGQARILRRQKEIDRDRQRAATVLQTWWRGVQARQELDRLCTAAARLKVAINLQMRFRIQSAKRQLFALKTSATEQSAATKIQASYRMFQAMLLLGVLKERAARIEAAVCIQSALRGSKVRMDIRQMKLAAICLQACFRRSTQQFLYSILCQSTRKIQSQWRRFSVARKYHLVRYDVRQCQSVIRMFLAKRQSLRRRLSVLSIQAVVRRFLACRAVSSLLRQKQLERNSATAIQSFFRGYQARLRMEFDHACATLIQSVYRRHVAVHDYQFARSDITVVQSLARCWLAKQEAWRRQKAVLVLQCWFRGNLARMELYSLYREQQQRALECYAALEIQRMVRGHFGRRIYRIQQAARKIQKTWRCYTVHVDYILTIISAVDIQAWVRRHLALNAFDKNYLAIVKIQSFARLALYKLSTRRQAKSAAKIQSLCRMMRTRKQYLLYREEEFCATTIQSVWRMYKARREFLLVKLAATMVQSVARGVLVRQDLVVRVAAATEIQRMWRGYVGFDNYIWTRACVVGLQACIRGFLAQQQARELRSTQTALKHLRRRSSVKIQRYYRLFAKRMQLNRSASRIQDVARYYLSRIGFAKFRRGVVRAQAAWRARRVRREIPESVRERAASIQEANIRAKRLPELKLGNQTIVALNILKNSTSLMQIMEAVTILEISTRLSRNCCESFVYAGASAVLLDCISRCNRSLPHTKLMRRILLVLVNIARYDDLVDCLATPGAVKVFVDLVQMFRDKERIFGRVVYLLSRIMNQEVRTICQEFENLKRLKSIHKLCLYKLSVSYDKQQKKHVQKLGSLIRLLES